jgi:hypothetical protein
MRSIIVLNSVVLGAVILSVILRNSVVLGTAITAITLSAGTISVNVINSVVLFADMLSVFILNIIVLVKVMVCFKTRLFWFQMNDLLVHAGYSSYVAHPLQTIWIESHQVKTRLRCHDFQHNGAEHINIRKRRQEKRQIESYGPLSTDI